MSTRNTVLRSLHDVGLAAWFGGSLMGAIGLNGAAARAKDPSERLRLASVGWARWTPVQLTAIVAHGVGSLGLVGANTGRLVVQEGAKPNSVLKTAFTIAAGAASVAGGLAGATILRHAEERSDGVTEPSQDATDALQVAQRVEQVTQWAIPLLTGVLLVLAAQQGEQQRPVAGWAHDLRGRAVRAVTR